MFSPVKGQCPGAKECNRSSYKKGEFINCHVCSLKWVLRGARMDELLNPNCEDFLLDLRDSVVLQAKKDMFMYWKRIYSIVQDKYYERLISLDRESSFYKERITKMRLMLYDMEEDIPEFIASEHYEILTGSIGYPDDIIDAWFREFKSTHKHFSQDRFDTHLRLIRMELERDHHYCIWHRYDKVVTRNFELIRKIMLAHQKDDELLDEMMRVYDAYKIGKT